MKSGKVISLLLFLCVFVFRDMYPVRLELIKGTYTIFVPEYAHLSPIHGAMWWEAGIIRNYYNFGFIDQQAKKGAWLAEGDGPVRLVHALFHVVEGSFGVSVHRNYPAFHLSVRTVARIVAHLENERAAQRVPVAGDIQKIIQTDPDVQNSLKQTESEKETLRKKYDDQIKEKNNQLQKVQAKLDAPKRVADIEEKIRKLEQETGGDTEKRERQLQGLRKGLENARAVQILPKDSSDKERLLKEYDELVKSKESELIKYETVNITGGTVVQELAQAIADSCQDSPFYPRHTVFYVLSAFVYRKAQSKKELGEFINTMVLNITKQPVLSSGIDGGWLTQEYGAADADETKAQAQRQADSFNWLPIDPQDFEQIVYAQLFERFYRGNMPKVAEYATVKFLDVHPFANCMETTIRNLCNCILYNSQGRSFDIDKHPAASDNLIGFYRNNRDASRVEDAAVHAQWTNMVENLPLVAYKSAVRGNLVQGVPGNCVGFLYGLSPEVVANLEKSPEDARQVKIGQHWYCLVDPKEYKLFEVRAFWQNLIVLMDTLFQLKLFGEGQEREKNFILPNFNSRYTQPLFSKFARLNEDCERPRETALDNNDFTAGGIQVNCTDFTIDVHLGHGVLRPQSSASTIFESKIALPLCNSLVECVKQGKGMPLCEQLLAIFPFDRGLVREPSWYKYWFFYTFGSDAEKCRFLCDYVSKRPDTTLLSLDRQAQYLAKQFVSLPIQADWRYQRDFAEKIDVEWASATKMRDTISNFVNDTCKERFFDGTTDKDYFAEVLVALVGGYFVRAQDARVYLSSLDLTQTVGSQLVRKMFRQCVSLEATDPAYKQFLIDLIGDLMKKSTKVRAEALVLCLEYIVKVGKTDYYALVLEYAMQGASVPKMAPPKKGDQRPDFTEKLWAVKCIKELINKGYAPALEAAQKVVKFPQVNSYFKLMLCDVLARRGIKVPGILEEMMDDLVRGKEYLTLRHLWEQNIVLVARNQANVPVVLLQKDAPGTWYGLWGIFIRPSSQAVHDLAEPLPYCLRQEDLDASVVKKVTAADGITWHVVGVPYLDEPVLQASEQRSSLIDQKARVKGHLGATRRSRFLWVDPGTVLQMLKKDEIDPDVSNLLARPAFVEALKSVSVSPIGAGVLTSSMQKLLRMTKDATSDAGSLLQVTGISAPTTALANFAQSFAATWQQHEGVTQAPAFVTLSEYYLKIAQILWKVQVDLLGYALKNKINVPAPLLALE